MGRDEGQVKGDSLQPNTVVSAVDNCWPVYMHSGMGVHSEKWPWPMVECGHLHSWIANSAVYHTPPRTALENATPIFSWAGIFLVMTRHVCLSISPHNNALKT